MRKPFSTRRGACERWIAKLTCSEWVVDCTADHERVVELEGDVAVARADKQRLCDQLKMANAAVSLGFDCAAANARLGP